MRNFWQVLFITVLLSACKFPNHYGNIVSYQKGMAVPSWRRNEYLNDSLFISLSTLKDLGADCIAITPTWHQLTKQTNEIYPTLKTPSDSAIRNVILVAQSLGYRLMIKPHLDVEDGTLRTELQPTDFLTWFRGYTNFILHYVNIAQSCSVDEFCIGTELKKLSSRAEWRMLIDSIRKIYNGQLTYAANWDEYPNVTFWNYLDDIGVNAYFPLAENCEATIEEYLENFQLWLNQIDNFQTQVRKKIIITEIGYRSIKGSGLRPYDWQTSGLVSENDQAHAYQTVLETLQRKSWLKGIYFWYWQPILQEDSIGYTPYLKKAALVLRQFWR